MATDPRCPECDEPVGTTATYCMHCDAEFDAPVDAGDTDSEIARGDTGTQTSDDTVDGAGTAESDRSVRTDLTTWEQRLSRWLGPDGWIDDSLTVLLAIGAGLVIGPLTIIVLALLRGSLWSLAVGFVVLNGSIAHLANQRTVYGTVRGGCFGISALLVVLPVGFIIWISENPLRQLNVFLAFELTVGFVVVPLVVVGTLVGRLRAKVEGE
jgi:hypothetical protein